MTREVSRRTSRPPEMKAKVSYPDQPGKKDLDPKIVRDVPDPARRLENLQNFMIEETLNMSDEEIMEGVDPNEVTKAAKEDLDAAIQRAKETDHYLSQLGPPLDESKRKK